MSVSLFKNLTHGATPLTGAEQIPVYQAGQPDDVYITPDDLATSPVKSRFTNLTAITPTLADAFFIIETTATVGILFTIPNDAAVPYPAGTVIGTQQLAVGRITHQAGVGVTVRWPKAADGTTDCKLSRAINSPASFRKRGTNDWICEGDLSSS